MQALRFHVTIPRYALGLALGRFIPSIYWSGLSCTRLEEVPEPRLPAPDWVRIHTRYGGICGSDLGAIRLDSSPTYSALASSSFTFGHENVGRIAEVGPAVRDWQVGERVVVEPYMWCRPLGFQDLCRYCARGETNLCERGNGGTIPRCIQIGNCRETGGSWSRSFVAHESQLYRVPEEVSDENALLVEPFSTALHGVLEGLPGDKETVLILGAGIIGLLTLAAIRAVGSHARILVLARYPFQADAARRLGADEVIEPRGDYYARIARETGAEILRPIIGKRFLRGGVDRTFECVGSGPTIDDALRLTRGGGEVALVGVPGIVKGIDFAPVLSKELALRAVYLSNHAEPYAGRKWRAFDLTLELMKRKELDLGWLVTHKFPLDDYGHAFQQLFERKSSGVIKAVFEFED